MSTALRGEFRLALEVPGWAWRFYLRHFLPIVGLSLVASVQRLMVVNWAEQIPTAAVVASEILVLGARLLLFVVLWQLAMRNTAWHWDNLSEFARLHWPSLLIQGALLSVAFLVFDLLAENVVAGLLAEETRSTYLAVLLFVKNPTVIAFTFVWWVGLARQMLRTAPEKTPA
ncbi:hypothetical protein [Actinoalloteichus hymeniacidonis]|uniref:Uncharacterized protein n=1 Tax=Actinoalloteichus hymeniacidonis TaxID=340345 RepID=A0AAC9HNK5_9PSEU|nr:hypothetical protein [Actinoalloteichus hymeniacidonis]AOS62061.1 hypothetical protein TL08_06180 [Actinoalloteichus hymeniacidonis]MBB5909917.1 hypothetical protein [Actinoalloteichus hymeniacidonis]